MKVERHEGARGRKVLLGLIVHDSVLSSVVPRWTKEGLFGSEWENTIAGWCVGYFNRYGKAPGRAVEGLYESWASSAPKDTVKVVEKFLTDLSGEYGRIRKQLNPAYLLDQASEHFSRIRLMRLKEQLEGDLDSGKISDAEERVNSYHRVEIGKGSGIDVLNDRSAVRRVFDRRSDPVVTYPGALGKFFGNTLERDGFVAYMGREKIGKTWWLLDLAWQALLGRKRVAFFEVGDLSEEQINGRFMTRAARHPIESDDGWPCTLKVPKAVTNTGDDVTVETEDRVFDAPLAEIQGWKALRKVAKERVKSDDPYLKLWVYPNSTLSTSELRSVLRAEEKSGWVPDLVVVDYADILAAPSGFSESRDAVNANWKALRAMSQELHCLVVTATQANAESYRAEGLDMRHYSEDKRKFAHTTGMVGLSQTEEEKQQEVYRLNWLVLRERRHSVRKFVYVAGCLGIGCPAMRSTF